MREKTFDAFVSYSSLDQAIAEDLVIYLRRRGLHIWFDKFELNSGSYVQSSLVEAVESSKRMLALFSPAFFGRKKWTQFETEVAMQGDPMAENRPLIPILIQDCEIPKPFYGIERIDGRSGFSGRVIDRICWSLKNYDRK